MFTQVIVSLANGGVSYPQDEARKSEADARPVVTVDRETRRLEYEVPANDELRLVLIDRIDAGAIVGQRDSWKSEPVPVILRGALPAASFDTDLKIHQWIGDIEVACKELRLSSLQKKSTSLLVGLDLYRRTRRLGISALLRGKGEIDFAGCSFSLLPAVRPVGVVSSGREFLPLYDSDRAPHAQIFVSEPAIAQPIEKWYVPAREDGREVWPRESQRPKSIESSTCVFLTVDTEDTYFDDLRLITGAGIEPAVAIRGIMDRFESHGFRGVFFVNVFEHLASGTSTMADIVREISERGHEVELHTHPSQELDFFRTSLTDYDEDGQTRIIEYGQELIQKWTGRTARCFRAGGYRYDETTLRVLEKLDIMIDSSYFHGFVPMERYPGSMLTPRRVGKLIEVPGSYAPLILTNGTLRHSKFDVNSLRTRELNTLLDFAKRTELPFLNFMMHSFSFIKKRKIRPGLRVPVPPPGPEVLCRSPNRGERSRIDVEGGEPRVLARFERLLDRLRDDPAFHVRTLREAIGDLTRTADAEIRPDQLPILYRTELGRGPRISALEPGSRSR